MSLVSATRHNHRAHLVGLSCSKSSSTISTTDIYLGGESPTSWLNDTAIPLIRKNGLTFSLQDLDAGDQTTPIELSALDTSRALLFVITKETRSVATTILAGHYIGKGCNVTLCIQDLPNDCRVKGEQLSQLAINDYNRSRAYLRDYAKQANVHVFDGVKEAVEHAMNQCRSSIAANKSTAASLASVRSRIAPVDSPANHMHGQPYPSYLTNVNCFISSQHITR
jgi:hypothetical protein